ncbi:MAG: EVE domain-containing protein [Curvibacter sp.]|nr:EVE domain-containing protein [Curvibacter sp.]
MQPDLFERPAAPARNWVAVACAEHARRGREHQPLGFMQVCHGRLAPLRRLRPGDRVAYYAPSTRSGEVDGLRSWVSLGRVAPGLPYAFDMGGGFVPHRRDVRYDLSSREIPIAPLLDRLEFIEDRRHWGQRFRFGLFEIGDHDMRLIADAMAADLSALGF